MDFRQLELFLAVIENSGVTRAAEKAGLSPGAISLQLRNLAAELRTDLFVKSGKRLLPTPAALLLAERARPLLRQLRQLEHEFDNTAASDSRPFHLACGATTLIHLLGKPLRRLRKQYPNNSIQVTVYPTEEMVAGVLERRFDLALVSLPYPTAQLVVFPLFEEELLVLRPSPLRVRGWHVGSIKPEELSRAPFLLYPKRSNMRSMIDRYFAEMGIDPKVIMEAEDTEVIKRLVECGFGYSILPEFALRSGTRFFRIFRVPGHRLVRQQALVMARSDNPRALALSVARFLQTALASVG